MKWRHYRIELYCRTPSCCQRIGMGKHTHCIGVGIFNWRIHRTRENLIYSFTTPVDCNNRATAGIYRTLDLSQTLYKALYIDIIHSTKGLVMIHHIGGEARLHQELNNWPRSF